MDTAAREPGFDFAALRAVAGASAVRALPRVALRQLSPCFTRTGGALGIDLTVFVALALMAWTLLTPWGAPLGDGAGWMLTCLGIFTAFWCSIAASDFDRFCTLRRRFLALDPQPLRSTQPAEPPPGSDRAQASPVLPPLRVRSAYRPARMSRPPPSRLLLRATGRGH